jgi:hypothetical protein
MTTSKIIFENIRAVLEVGYYAAGIALAFLAYRGLAQIKLTKELATTNAKREAFKLALKQCHFYAEDVVTSRAKVAALAMTKGIVFAQPCSFKVSKGEIIEVSTPGRNIVDECQKLDQELLLYMNRLEAFAMAFTSGVADEEVAYRETARAFCQTFPEAVPFIDYCRKNEVARYESAIQLYELWQTRLFSEALTKQRQHIQQAEENLKKAEPPRIKTIGTD